MKRHHTGLRYHLQPITLYHSWYASCKGLGGCAAEVRVPTSTAQQPKAFQDAYQGRYDVLRSAIIYLGLLEGVGSREPLQLLYVCSSLH